MTALIVGAGAQGRVILDILRAAGGYELIEFVDDNERLWGTRLNGALVRGGLDRALREKAADTAMIIAIGDPRKRLALAARISEAGVAFLNAIHPSAVVMPTVRMGSGNMIGATAVINTSACVGNHTIVNTGAVIEHDCQIADGGQISPGAHLGGRVRVGRAAFISTGAIVLPRLSIGPEAIVGAGAVVTRDLPGHVLAIGVPARIREQLTEGFDWSKVL
jgi:sugar O-acyltransferase (sialic acid O-acetyltransferase NeuD family)